MLRPLSYLAAVVIVVASGLVHGIWTGRWTTSDVARSRAAVLDRVPMTVGDWTGQALTLDPRVMESAGITGYFMRRYENRRHGGSVTALLVCGPPGPISVHTPEVCYAGAGYEPESRTTKLAVNAAETSTPSPDELWVVNFAKSNSTLPEHLRIFYAWSTGGPWKASDRPRLDFGSAPALYKLYIVRETTGADEPLQNDPCVEFARQLRPELRKVLSTNP